MLQAPRGLTGIVAEDVTQLSRTNIGGILDHSITATASMPPTGDQSWFGLRGL